MSSPGLIQQLALSDAEDARIVAIQGDPSLWCYDENFSTDALKSVKEKNAERDGAAGHVTDVGNDDARPLTLNQLALGKNDGVLKLRVASEVAHNMEVS